MFHLDKIQFKQGAVGYSIAVEKNKEYKRGYGGPDGAGDIKYQKDNVNNHCHKKAEDQHSPEAG
jgi:hypothetical protein